MLLKARANILWNSGASTSFISKPEVKESRCAVDPMSCGFIQLTAYGDVVIPQGELWAFALERGLIPVLIPRHPAIRTSMAEGFLGPLVIGYGFSACLFGVVSVQTVVYYRTFDADPWTLKATVLLVWLLELGHTSMASATVYIQFVFHFGDFKGFSDMYRLFAWNGFVAILISFVVQAYSAYRLRVITKSLPVPLFCGGLLVARTIFYTVAIVFDAKPFPYLQGPTWRIILILVGVLSIVTDALLAFRLSYALWKRRLERAQSLGFSSTTNPSGPRFRKTGFDFLDQFIVLCISSNAITCIASMIVFILFQTTNNLTWLPVSYFTTRLYSISFMSLILQRQRRKERSQQTIGTFPMADILTGSHHSSASTYARSQEATTSVPVPTSPSSHALTSSEGRELRGAPGDSEHPATQGNREHRQCS
ncbi:hypothetical protein CC2G_007049 [Coprinopsis cinerea AmutBmut pab1-1]|nr:hypothetical protein CC2G_007049 [Coprinopsis cinerea AmutBmut pab1-1]